MKILLLGSGGREHAFAWKIVQSPLCEKLFIAPGNSGTAQHGTNINISVMDFDAISKFCDTENIDLLIVAPDDPNVGGIWDYFQTAIPSPLEKVPKADEEKEKRTKIKILAPSKHGAMLEGSKSFAKEFMLRNNIPTANYQTFTKENIDDGICFIEKQILPIVLKADGLALGKGVLICNRKEEAKQELKSMLLENKFGGAASKVVIEQFLTGIEMSVFIITDGKNYVMLPNAKDYKRAGEGDTGLNTGGMGAISPVPFAGDELMMKIKKQIIEPTLQGLQKEKISYHGFIYFGLMIVNHTEPFIIEYNSRMGDPETQVVFPRIESDLVQLILDTVNEDLENKTCKISSKACATVVLTSGGYPGEIEKGKIVSRLNEVNDSIIFHAGATQNAAGEIITNGGRVFAVTTLATSLNEALDTSNRNAEKIIFEKKYYRKDIGKDVL